MLSWFKKKREQGPKVVGRSPGGSPMLRYGGEEFAGHPMGFAAEETEGYAEERERGYEALFGESAEVLHEMVPFVPHVDVFQYPPTAERDFWTLATSGMSDLPMTLPRGVPREYRRGELIFYCDEPRPVYCELLRVMAHFPHDNKTWLGPGHTMPNGDPPAPLFEDTPDLDSLVFSASIVSPDNTLAERLVLNGDPVSFLWVVPITAAECEFKLQKGMDALYDLFDEVEHPHVFTGNRESYV